MNPDDLIVEVRDSTLRRVASIPNDDIDLEVTERFNGTGTWKVTLPAEHPAASYLKVPGSGIVVSLDGFTFSGPTTRPTTKETVEDILGTVTFDGLSDTTCLDDALCYLDPTNLSGGVGDGSVSDVAETLMHALVAANIGAGALTTRRKSGLTNGPNLGRGASVTVLRKFQPLSEALRTAASPSGLGFRVVQQDASLVFETYAVIDRSRAVRLTLSNSEITSQSVAVSAPNATHAIVAGQGWATSRKMIEYSTPESLAAGTAWNRRIEVYVDSKGTNITADLNAAGDEVLKVDGGTLTGVQVTPSDSSDLRYGSDWSLGDKVSVETSGLELGLAIAGAVIKADTSGVRIGLVIGSDSALDGRSNARSLEGVEARVSGLERNYATDATATDSAQVVCTSDLVVTTTSTSAVPGVTHAISSPGVGAVWLVDLDCDVSINSAGAVNIVDLLVDGASGFGPSVITQGAASTRIAGHKKYRITGISAGAHTFSAAARNNAAGMSATVRTGHTAMTVQRVA